MHLKLFHKSKSETYGEARQELLDVVQINTIIVESALHHSEEAKSSF